MCIWIVPSPRPERAAGLEAVHNTDVTNPENPMFFVKNFNDPTRDSYGVFGEWERIEADWSLELGLRFNRIATDTDEVYSSGMMGMMGANAAALADAFNNTDRSESYRNTDWVVKFSQRRENGLALHAGLARKSRAPSWTKPTKITWQPTTVRMVEIWRSAKGCTARGVMSTVG